MPPDVLSREMEESAKNVRALESVHAVNHPKVQRQLSDDLTPERQLSNQTREPTIERADEPPTQRPRLENQASSIRWSKVDDPRHWVPTTAVEDEENMWTEMDSEVLWQQQVDDHIWENNGQPACLCQEEWDELFSNELPRHMITESEWAAILDTSAVTIISPVAAKDIRKHLSHRIVPSRHVYREAR